MSPMHSDRQKDPAAVAAAAGKMRIYPPNRATSMPAVLTDLIINPINQIVARLPKDIAANRSPRNALYPMRERPTAKRKPMAINGTSPRMGRRPKQLIQGL